MDFELTAEQRLIVETVRDFVEQELYPHEDEVERRDEGLPELAEAIRGKAIASGLYAASGSEQTSRGPKKLITTLLVDSDSPGLQVRRGPACVSNRGYHQCELVFAGCRVPAANRLGEEGRGFELMGQWLGASRLTVAGTGIGRARPVPEGATEWVARPTPIGHGLCALPAR